MYFVGQNKMKQDRSNNEKLLMVITIITIVGIAVYTLVIEPQVTARRANLQRMHQLQLDLIKMRSDMLIKDQVEKTYAQVESLIHEAATDQQEISLFSRELNDLYSALPLRIRTVKIMPLIERQHYRKLSIKAEMTGNIKAMTKLIDAAESSSMPVRIEYLDLKARETTDDVLASFVFTKVVSCKQR